MHATVTEARPFVHNGLVWRTYAGVNRVNLGLLPFFLTPLDQRPAAVQFNERYRIGGSHSHPGFTLGGWRPMPGFTMNEARYLDYPGDPALPPLAFTRLREEIIIVYQYSIIAILNQDTGDLSVARLD